MKRAKELLRSGTLSVKEIANELGYSRQHDLTRAFRKYSGTSPTEWRMRITLSLQDLNRPEMQIPEAKSFSRFAIDTCADPS
jgi:AraC-like DNA-binding protein